MDNFGFLVHAAALIAVVAAVLMAWDVRNKLNEYAVRHGRAKVQIELLFYIPYMYLVCYVFWLFS